MQCICLAKVSYRIEPNRCQLWDYSAPGSYFVTICVAGRACILGDVVNGKMELSEYGKIVETEFLEIPEYHKRVLLDAYVVMPNHVHCVITLGNYGFDNGVSLIGENDDAVNDNGGLGVNVGVNVGVGINEKKIHEFSRPVQTTPKPTTDEIKQYRKQRRKMIIPKLTGKFQMQTSKQINILRNTPGVKNCQANYHDHIIRDKKAYQNILKYIINNPQKWWDDKFNSVKKETKG